MLRPVSVVTVSYDTYFFVRLLVEKVREHVGTRDYEIIVVDRGSRDASCGWLRQQKDVRLLVANRRLRGHAHGEAAELGVKAARFESVVLLDSDAHPFSAEWLAGTADRLDAEQRLAGAVFHRVHEDNPHGWYIHPHFMAFAKSDLGSLVTLRKTRGRSWDTGEETTLRMLQAGLKIICHPLTLCARFAVGHPHFPTVAGGVFHAWYGTRISKEKRAVQRETEGAVTGADYLAPLQARLREAYQLDY